jgi:thiamine-phosphate pyrophosphorylase
MILYAITDEKLTPYITILEQVRFALEGGAKYVQLRDKHSNFSDALAISCALRELCVEFEAKFIVNDSVRLAKESNAHGVHLGDGAFCI